MYTVKTKCKKTGHETLIECSWVTVRDFEGKIINSIEMMTDNNTFDSMLYDKDITEIYVMNENGKTIESYRWPSNSRIEKIGTIEPDYKHKLSKDKIAFIIGAIKKYGSNFIYSRSLIDYINEQISNSKLGEDVVK